MALTGSSWVYTSDNCNCKRLGALQTRLSTVNDEETILVIGGSAERGHHSFIDGRLSSTNFTSSLASQIYKRPDKVTEATTFVSRVHGLTDSFGNSGSAVMDKSGKVIGMILAINVNRNLCVTMEEISKAYEQILDTSAPRFVACTAHESALLGRTHWAGKSGKSINEMNALATAMDAQYFAVAHDDLEADAFTFHALWWEILPGNDDMKEDASRSVSVIRLSSQTANVLSVEPSCVDVLRIYAEGIGYTRRNSAKTTIVVGPCTK